MTGIKGGKLLFDDSEIIEIKILQILDTEEKWWQSLEIAKLLNQSKSTTQKYLKLLKEKISTFDKELVDIEISSSRGIFFTRAPSFNLQFLYTEILKELLLYSVVESFIYDGALSITQFSMVHYVSVTSIRRKYTIIQDYLEKLELTIKKDQLIGEEKQIRWFLTHFFWEVYQSSEWPFSTISKNELTTIVRDIEDKFSLQLIPEMREQLLYWLAVNIIRTNKGYKLPIDEEIDLYLKDHPVFFEFRGVIRAKFYNPIRSEKEFLGNVGEVQHLFFLCTIFPVLEGEETLSTINYQMHKNKQTQMYAATQRWITMYEELFDSIDGDLKKNQIEKKLLRIHSYSYLYKMGDDLFHTHDYIDDLFVKYPNYSKKMNQLYQQIQPSNELVLKNQQYLMKAYMLLCYEEFEMINYEKNILICLSIGDGSTYEGIMKNELKTKFQDNYNLKFISQKESADIWITNLPITNPDDSKYQVSVNNYFTKRDYKYIENFFIVLRYHYINR